MSAAGVTISDAASMYRRTVRRPDGSLNKFVPRLTAYGYRSFFWGGWQPYGIMSFSHSLINHRYCFTDPITGATTNNVECFWKNAKMRFKKMNGTRRNMVPGYLDEFMWRQLCGKTISAFFLLFEQIAHFYNPNLWCAIKWCILGGVDISQSRHFDRDG